MKIALDSAGEGYRIRAYAAGRLVLVRVERDPEGSARVYEQVLTASAIVSPAQILSDWQPGTTEVPTLEALAPGLALEPEVLLLGCGPRPVRPAPLLTRAVNARGIGFEVMDTRAACHTYNVLLLEGRRVAAALII